MLYEFPNSLSIIYTYFRFTFAVKRNLNSGLPAYWNEQFQKLIYKICVLNIYTMYIVAMKLLKLCIFS